MDPYSPRHAPPPFPLRNTGAICHFNSLLQALASLTALTRAVLANADALRATRTGAALLEFVRAYAAAEGARPAAEVARAGIAGQSARVLRALMADLQERASGDAARFGRGQEGANEGLVLLLDMLAPEGAPSPVAELFRRRYRCVTECGACGAAGAPVADEGLQFSTFAFDAARPLAAQLRMHEHAVPGYRCERCGAAGPARRRYVLTMVSEVVVCVHAAYPLGGRPAVPPMPARLEFPAGAGGAFAYEAVAQVDHSGSMTSGHYVARGRRADPDRPGAQKVFAFNDASPPAGAQLSPEPGTYMVFYHLVAQ